jgi:uncharacterized secreted protein with C-terminal beta-propeller domain
LEDTDYDFLFGFFFADLSNAENPVVKGQLKIPGFSEYLHPISNTMLLGLGKDTTEAGSGGTQRHCIISIYDYI